MQQYASMMKTLGWRTKKADGKMLVHSAANSWSLGEERKRWYLADIT